MAENIRWEVEQGIGTLTIQRPKALNALNAETMMEIEAVVDQVANDDSIRVVIITGDGEKAFVAGADIAEMKDKTVEEAAEYGAYGNKIFRQIETLHCPVIAAVNGFALGGGCELSMACDIRIAAENAIFGQPEVGLGITPGFGGTQRLSRLIGSSNAKLLIYTGNIIDANEAYRMGLVNSVVEPDLLISTAEELASNIASKSQMAVKYSKTAINKGIQTDIDTGLEIEKNLFALCFASQDQKEGMTAFLEKRKPNFK